MTPLAEHGLYRVTTGVMDSSEDSPWHERKRGVSKEVDKEIQCNPTYLNNIYLATALVRLAMEQMWAIRKYKTEADIYVSLEQSEG